MICSLYNIRAARHEELKILAGARIVLTNQKEIEIIQAAKQKNVRDPKRSREHFHHIIRDFFDGVELTGSYVDLGPGQFDFGELVREKGGDCMGVDFDPAVVELGTFKGFRTREMNLKKLPKASWDEQFDGAFNKFALNAYWSGNDTTAQQDMANAISAMLTAEGWAWIAPWNGVPKNQDLSDTDIAETIAKQRAAFETLGFDCIELSIDQAKFYGINGTVANNVVFTRNLTFTG